MINRLSTYLLCLCLILLGGMNVTFAQRTTQIEIISAQSLEGIGNATQKLAGNCAFKQEGMILYCDSAYLFEATNSVDAYGHVRLVQGDTVELRGEKLNYDGNTKKAVVTGKTVTLVDRSTKLTTTRLNYDMNTEVANYTDSAYIVDKDNILTSRIGYYYAGKKEFFFRRRVVLTNPQYIMRSDTLRYNSRNRTSYFVGPTTITSKENLIYCEDGWYNTIDESSSFRKNAYMQTKERTLKGDTLLYNRKTEEGRAFGNVEIIDTAQKIVITGDIGHYKRENQHSLVTRHALLKQFIDKDTLYLHGDTLQSDFDSTKNERKLYAYHHVKIFKHDMQGACDTLFYSSVDSTMRLYKEPVLWSAENQITGAFITLTMKNKQMHLMNVYSNAFMISKEDTLRYNQIKGKNMTGYFTNNKLYKMKVEGNGQSVYYGKDKFNKLVGANKTECSDMMIYVKENKVQKITLLNKPEATFYPIQQVNPQEFLLKDFIWLEERRPKIKEDVYFE